MHNHCWTERQAAVREVFRLRNSFPFGACVVEDLRIRNYARTAVECSVRLVAELAKHFNKPPEQLGKEGDPLVAGKDTGSSAELLSHTR